MKRALLTRGASTEWETPDCLFAELHRRFAFTVDVCATRRNAKLPRFWSPAVDGLSQDWAHERCWMNPPYGENIAAWAAKARSESFRGACTVGLLPARTDTAWWHEHVWDGRRERPKRGVRVQFLEGRIKFRLPGRGSTCAPFPSVLIVWAFG